MRLSRPAIAARSIFNAKRSVLITKSKPVAIDFFCGAGGISLGLEKAGFEVLWAVDSWKTAIESYKLNFRHPAICADVSEVSLSSLWDLAGVTRRKVDLVVGGPPCQGFSVQRIGQDKDARNDLVAEYAKFIVDIRPTVFLMENVPGLLGKRGAHLFDAFQAKVASAGYKTTSATVNAASFGVPQVRRRVFVIGWLGDAEDSFVFPKPTVPEHEFSTVWDTISDMPTPADPGAQGPGIDPLHRRTKLSKLNLERLKHIPPGGGMEDLPVRLRVNCHKAGADKIGHRYVYGRLAPDRPASTITARFDSFTRGRFAHPFEDRNITLREGARLQSFPDKFKFFGSQEDIAAQIGNAVPPALAASIAKDLVKFIARLERGRAKSKKVRAPVDVSTSTRKPSRQLSLFGELEAAK